MPYAAGRYIDPGQIGDFISMLERGHHVADEPAELLLKLRGGKAFRPMDAKIFQVGYFASMDLLPSITGWAIRETRPFFHAIAKRRECPPARRV